MLSRVMFVVVAVFWVTMNVLLWRAEFGDRKSGSPVPVDLVWRRILTAPDNSSLTIFHHRERIGYCNWITSVSEAWSAADDEATPAKTPTIRSHRLRLEGGATFAEWLTNRVQFDASLKLNGERKWEEFRVRAAVQPAAFEVRSNVTNRTVRLLVEDGDNRYARVFEHSELQNPETILSQLLGPVAGVWLNQIQLPAAHSGSGVSLGLTWEAREELVRLGPAEVRGYRLFTRVLDRFEIAIYVSRVGEILRVELPGEFLLVNEPPAVL